MSPPSSARRTTNDTHPHTTHHTHGHRPGSRHRISRFASSDGRDKVAARGPIRGRHRPLPNKGTGDTGGEGRGQAGAASSVLSPQSSAGRVEELVLAGASVALFPLRRGTALTSPGV